MASGAGGGGMGLTVHGREVLFVVMEMFPNWVVVTNAQL